MNSKSYPTVIENEWVYPRFKKFYMACCDCGLIHEMDFEIVMTPQIGTTSKGTQLVKILPVKSKDLRIRMRARRCDRATARLRKEQWTQGLKKQKPKK